MEKTGQSLVNHHTTNDTRNHRPQRCSTSYLSEWQSVRKIKSIDQLRFWSLNGYLPNCRFTSICWNLLLNVLPIESEKWLSTLRANRQGYETTRKKLMVRPSIQDGLDLAVHNPLSQCEESSWNRYFEDSELKKLICLDVQRAFPGEDYFQVPRVQDMMISILFCYARSYPNLSYIQGMHEVLAPLIFVFQLDRNTFRNSTEKISCDLLQEAMDETYIEHDSYLLFEAVMRRLSHWYDRNETPPAPKIDLRKKLLDAQPFAKHEEVIPTPKIVQRLQRMQEGYLKIYEPELYAHLTDLEILPQVYGIRWGRLMVGREFCLFDLLVIWDAIFSDQNDQFELLDFIMLAMLTYIKDDLLCSDYANTIKQLMTYPSNPDVRAIIKMARSYQKSKSDLDFVMVSASEVKPGNSIRPLHVPRVTNSSLNRSSSVPRRPDTLVSGHFKTRSNSVEQRHQHLDRRKSSPTVDATHSLNVTFSKNKQPEKPHSNHHTEERNGKKIPLFGHMFGRPKEHEITDTRPDKCVERQLKEIVVIRRSEPIATKNALLRDTANNSDSDEGSPYGISNKQKIRAEELLTTSLTCARRLEHYQDKLQTRLTEMNLQSDLCMRSILDGISEVVDSLRESKLRPRTPSGPDPYDTEFKFTPHRSRIAPKDHSPCLSNTIIQHPLMPHSP